DKAPRRRRALREVRLSTGPDGVRFSRTAMRRISNMTSHHLTRRSMLRGGAGLAGLTAFGSAPALSQASTRLRSYWWGSPARARRTNDVPRLSSTHHPEVTIVGEVGAGSEYWTKLATMMVARNVPDVSQLEPNTLSDFASRGACQELEPLLPRT